MKNFSYLFAAYSIVWIMLFLYLFNISAKIGNLKREVESLRDLIGNEKGKSKKRL